MSTASKSKGFAPTWRLVLSIALLAVLALAATMVAAAPVTYQVTKTADTADGTCDADCSLREAIIAANANPGADTVILPAGTYTLSRAGAGEDACDTGDLDVTDDLSITGADQATTIIDGGGIDRVFHIAPSGAVLFDMADVTIRNGNAGSNSGGGMLNSQGAVTLEYCTITNNSGGGEGEGVLAILGGGGGGIYNDAGSLTLANCTVSYNLASDDDAGIPMLGAVGGGICNGPGTVTLTDSSLVHNSANGFGGLINLAGEVALSGCTIALNSAEGSYYGIGGGIGNYTVSEELFGEASATLSNCTITLNTGGGVIAMGATTTSLANCTVSHNSGGLLLGTGGIYAASTDGPATVNLKNTIVANSTSGDECSGIITSQGHNLASDGTCSLTGSGDQPNTDPLLGPLQDNGGPTLTRALLAGSPAIDAGDNVGCPGTDQRGEPRPEDGDGDLVAVCDIGAYEAAGLPPFSEITIQKHTNGYDADSPPGPYIPVGGGVNWTYEVSNSGDTLLNDIYITDDQGVTVTCPGASLDPDESMTCTASGTAQIGQYSNTATVYGTPPVGEAVSESDSSHYFGTSPVIDIEKATNGQDADGAPGPEVAVGDPVNWTYEVVNRGNVPLTGITVQDDQGAVVDCPHTALGPAEFMTCTASGVAELGHYENLGSVTGYYGTTQVTDSDASHYLGVTRADLSITKTSDPVTAYPGDQITYGIRVTNLGPSEAFGVVVSDVLPSAVAYELDTGSCSEGPAGTLTCSLGHMAAGESSAFNVYVRVPPEAPVTTIANTATVAGTEPQDPEAANNSATAQTVLLGKADLSIQKFGKPDGEVQAGEELTYTIIVDNLGPGLAHRVVVSDVIQSSGSFDLVSVTSDRPASCSPAPGGTYSERLELSCALNEALEVMTPDTPGRWILTIVVRANEAQSINNVARVTSSDLDPDPSNNEAVVEHEITEVADLSVTKSIATPPFPPFYAGNNVRFRLQVTNHGPSTAENVVVEDMLPQGVTVVNFDPGPGSCTTGTPGSTPLRCDLGTLAVDDAATVFVTVRIDPDYLGTLENDAWVYSGLFDPNNSNNRASVIVPVLTQANLSLDKEAPPPSWYAGEIRTYRYNIENSGPSVSRDVRLRDFLPDRVDFVSAYAFKEGSTGGIPLPCNASAGNVLICPLGDIPPTDPPGVVVLVDVYIKPDVPDGTWIYNNADLITDTPDPGGASDYVYTMVYNQADLSVRKTANPWKVFAGEQVMYTIEVTNHGPGNAYGVLVTDTLPSEVGFELSTDPDCYPLDGQVVCEWNMLGLGQTRSFQIFGRVDPEAAPGTVSNRVEVDSDADDPIGYNDYASAPILIQGRADLKVQKFGKPDGLVRAGDKLTYTIIVDNLGTGYAHNVTLDDVMKSDGWFDLMEVTSDRDALCDPETGTFQHDLHLTCALTDTLEVKGPTPGSGRWMITVIVIANEPQDINNVAYVAGSDYDPDLSNNEAIAEHEITAVADLELTKEAWGEMLVGCEGETELWLNEVAAGGTVTYTLTVSNTGPSTAENVVVLDEPLPFPDLLEIDVQSITPSQGNCQTANIVQQRRLSCNLGTILPEESATVTFVAHVPSWVADYTVLVNDAQAYSDMFDNNNGNDVVTNHTVVSRVADLMVEKTQDPEIALPGWDVTYSITVTNLGLSDVEGVLISDTIPVQVLNPTWTCCASDGQCDMPCEPPVCPEEPCPWPEIGLFAQADIPAGEWVIYTVEGTLDWWPCGPFTNTVEIIPPQSLVNPEVDIDPCDENNVAEAVNDPFCHFDPLVLKAYPGSDSPP